jgi:GntR family transcriptional repressor for pyruvate dehydrogenase complex
MAFQLQAVDRTRLSASIADQILAGIESGAFPPGSALPAERLLAARLGVSRSSVREAIRILEHTGILDVRTGSGTYVTTAGSAKVAGLRAQAVLTGEHSPLDVIATRRGVEPFCAELAAKERHERDVELVRETVETQAALTEAGADAAAADLDFHLAVAAATHNQVLLLLVERLVEIMRRSPWADLKHRSREDESGLARDIRQHRAILEAIERRDGPGAARAMRTHLAAVERDLLAQVE